MSFESIRHATLDAAIALIGGQARVGQQIMADEVAQALDSGVHLLVQAGTGTGKSLGYLTPAALWAIEYESPVLVATATLALQAQLANSDLPTVTKAIKAASGHELTFAIVKGRSNYACLLRVRDSGVDDQESLVGGIELAESVRASGADQASVLGAEVVALREWAESELAAGSLADRDDTPTHSPRAWAQISMPARECLGAGKCPYGSECFVEESRERARQVDLVVTNHALLAINAMHGGTALPEYGAVIIDEAHELTARVTGAASAELSPQQIERVARRAFPHLDDDLAVEFLELADTFRFGLDEAEVGRITESESSAAQACVNVRVVTRRVLTALSGGSASVDNERSQVGAAVKELFDVAERMAALSEDDVIWVSERERFGRQLAVAPLSVSDLMRDKVLGRTPCVLASATLTVGGSFDALASSVGLRREDQIQDLAKLNSEEKSSDLWRALDVGSPFDYRRQGILYVAQDVPNPGRDGIGPEALAVLAELVWGAGGRTLGLFASQRSADAAAVYVRKELPNVKVLLQGEAQLSELMRQFIAEPDTCLFGTLSLWQGIDVPGETCELVIIDKIPFPRPDDPLMQARQRAVAKAGGNGFMQVAATHAGLLLAQGSGRLIRRLSDRGVVAVLDPRLLSARYGRFLIASMPDFWLTSDQQVVVEALRRLAAERSAKE